MNLTVVLILLSGVCYFDEFEYLRSPSETAINNGLSRPVGQLQYVSDEFPGVPKSAEFNITPVVDHHLLQGSTPSILPALVRHSPSQGNKLFQIFSTYRI